jgi:hypothetical protein
MRTIHKLKRSKLSDLKNFRLEDCKIIKKCIIDLCVFKINSELRETLSNGKVIGNFLHVIFRKMRWEGYMSALEAM